MLKYLKYLSLIATLIVTPVLADSVLVIDAQYDQVTNNVKGRLEAAGHTVTITTDISTIPTVTTTYQQVWDLRYAAALTAGEQTAYQTYVTNGGFAYFVTENPGCCQSRNNSVAALITNLGGGTTTIGANFAMTNNVSSNVNTTYMTSGITVNYAAVSAIVNSQGIPLISDGAGAVSGMSWIGRAGALGSGVTGTIVTVADTNWLDASRFNVSGTTAQQQNVTALDDIIRGIVAGTVGGTISANGNGAAASNGAAQQQNQTPTVVSTAPGTPKVTSTNSNGTATTTSTSTRGTTVTTSTVTTAPTTYTASARDASTKNSKTIDITRTTTVVGTTPRTTVNVATTPVTTVSTTTTPVTTTTVTTPVTVTTYSDNSTTETDGTPVTTTSTTNTSTQATSTTNEVVTTTVRDNIVQSTSSDQKASVSAVGLKEALAITRFNPYIVDPLSTKDGAWAEPSMGYAKATGSFRTSALNFGTQKTIDENTIGIAGTFNKSNSHEFLNSQSQAETYGATAYILSKQSDVWIKGSLGFNVSEYQTTTSLPIFALANSSKVKAKNYYADIALYSPIEYFGIRPLVGVTLTNSVIDSKTESGSALLSTLPQDDKILEARPYVGARFDFNKNIGIETKVTQSKDFKTVGQIRLTAKQEIFENVFFNVQAGFDKGSNYTAAVGMVGLKWVF